MSNAAKGDPRSAKLVLVWNRDKPRYELTVKGFSVTRSSERECLQVAVDAMERGLTATKKPAGTPVVSEGRKSMSIMETRAANFLQTKNLPNIPLNGLRLKEEPVYASAIMAEFAANIQGEKPIVESRPCKTCGAGEGECHTFDCAEAQE